MAQKPESKRIGFIGLSAVGSWASISHLHYLRTTPHYKIIALQNSSKDSATAAKKAHNLPNANTHADPSSLAQDPNVDIVAVSVKVPQHYDLIKPALEANKDIFVEWPLARTLSEAEELLSLAQAKGVRTLVGLQARQSPAIVKAREIVQSGKLGRIVGTTMYGHGMLFGPQTPEHLTYTFPIENGANLLTIPFGHAVDALCYVLGEWESLTATLANQFPELAVVDAEGSEIRKERKSSHDYISVTGILADGGGVVDATYAGGASRTGRDFYWEINGTEGSLTLKGQKGHIQMFQPTLELVIGDGAGKKVEAVHVEMKGAEGTNHGDFSFNVGRAWDAWAGEGLEEGGSVTTFEDAVVRHRMMEAIYRSAEKGTWEKYL
ncbi:NAD-binding Rossmann fold oxidoreductase family protein [Massarina eburnea CBS 473.64]|uniref:NAD-binding Rossmann fold oxidoreductase family protein n=1 Tax=Massarina eburnea CBS 473.64 TaxID=1395130 RepID=A0A6A6S768_9PLEO|nr:NAD-binding Rossmann fold oxidoreductase family protein [Massarina eburnea CBS 473.64]